jgi:hypothetical protein
MIEHNQRNKDRFTKFIDIGDNNIVPLDIDIIE